MEKSLVPRNGVEPSPAIQILPINDWGSLPPADPLVKFLETEFLPSLKAPGSWEAARCSSAVYIVREVTTQWTMVAKFYSVKTGPAATKYAQREYGGIQLAAEAGLSTGQLRAVRAQAIWRGVLLMEYIPGLNLEDLIAIRRSQPGHLGRHLETVARFLAKLHTNSPQKQVTPDFQSTLHYAFKVVENLSVHGVIQDDPIIQSGLCALIEQWGNEAHMLDFTPVMIHGDATTSNFIFPADEQGVVAIDWERYKFTDPAYDLGRLIAEVSHGLDQHGGSISEATPLIDNMVDAYRRSLPPTWDWDAFIERTRFYRAISTLRIARNGWLSRLYRTSLVAQVMALLI